MKKFLKKSKAKKFVLPVLMILAGLAIPTILGQAILLIGSISLFAILLKQVKSMVSVIAGVLGLFLSVAASAPLLGTISTVGIVAALMKFKKFMR